MVTTLRPAQPDEWRTLGHVLGAAFVEDPVSQWTLGTPAAIEATFAALGRHVYLPRGACTLAGELGGAMWLRPGGSKTIPPLATAALALDLLRLSGPARVRRGLAVDAAMSGRRPKAPHFYLFAVGILPAARGQGLGRALIGEMTAEADAAGLPCWLENSNPRNEPLYRGLGFEPVETFAPAPGCPPLTTMLRPPA